MDCEEEEQQQQGSQSETYLMGFVVTDIYGLNNYSATITGRQTLGLVREPLNPIDPNTIKVLNTQTIQVGHIEPPVAAFLSPLIDAQLITVEAIIPNSVFFTNKFRIECQVHVFAHTSNFSVVKDAFSQSPLHFITHSDPKFRLSDSLAVKQSRVAKNLNNLDVIFKLMGDNLAKKSVRQPIQPPSNVIKSELLPHQKEALAWLLHRENSEELPPFWEQRDDSIFVNVLTGYQTDVRPEPLRGGIFADDIGLGKTLTLISLIAFDRWENMGNKKKRSRSDLDEDSPDMESKATLVVCTPSVISTWVTQLKEHTFPWALKIYMFYGDRRTRDVEELKNYDLVLTTYSTFAKEFDGPGTEVRKLEWRRIILDEAHMIKSLYAAQSLAVTAVKAKRRWAVTGTPYQNGSCDLLYLMAFLHFEPFSIWSYWQSLVQRPLCLNNESGLMRLKVLMAAISLRRTKDMALVELPQKTVQTHYVELSLEECKLYDEVKREAKEYLIRYKDHIHYSPVLSMILRLRQICTDFTLCPSDFKSYLLPSSNIKDVSKKPELLQTLVRVLQDVDDFDCPICISPPMDIVITCCAHVFCRGCILKTLQRRNPRCPLCRHSLSKSDLFSAPPESFNADSAELCSSEKKFSTKVSMLIKLLKESRDQHPAAKSVVFSHFRKLLLRLEEPLRAAGFKTLRLDGTMNAKHRAHVIEQFQVSGKDGSMVLLASLRASSAGINLTAASRVYLMEPWWNPGVEEQAVERVHRIGQKEAVKVFRLIAKNSIEEKILMLQEKKKVIAMVVSRSRSKDVVGLDFGMLDINDLRFVLEE